MQLKLPPPQWQKRNIGDLTVYESSTLAWLPRIVQGYTTRHSGLSQPPYDSLNLGDHVGDDSTTVRGNRERICADLGFSTARMVTAEQIHGCGVEVVTGPSATPIPGVDALVTRTPGLLLTLFFADCVPVYVVDPMRRVIGLAHAGWRGTESNIVGKMISTMKCELGAEPEDCLMGIGPSIGADSYEVDREVADRFHSFSIGRNSTAATAVQILDEFTGKYSLDMKQVIFHQALQAGIKAEYISVCAQDTYRNRRDFFSFRRDGPTGRNAAYLAIRED